MSFRITTQEDRDESAIRFAQCPEAFTQFLAKFTTRRSAVEAAESKLHHPYYLEYSIKPPIGSTMINAIYAHFDGTSVTAPVQLAESRDALEYQTWVLEKEGQVVHAKVNRVTQEVEIRAADPLTHFCEQYEKYLPGFTYFAGNLISLYDCTGDRMKLWSGPEGYAACMPSPLKYRGLEQFMSDYKDVLFVKPVEGTPVMSTALAMVERVSKLSLPAYLELSLALFCYGTGISVDQIKNSFTTHPFRLIGHTMVEGKRFFQYHAGAGIDQNRSKYYVYQAGPWKVQSAPPATMQEAHLGLQLARVHRRENGKGYGRFTNGHDDGGELPDERTRVTNALSLAMYHLKTRDIELRLGSPLTAQHVDEVLRRRATAYNWKFVMNTSDAIAAFGDEGHKDKYVAARTPNVLLIDLVSTAEPSFPKNTNMDTVWTNHYNNLLPAAPYIVFRKTPPSLASKVKVYKMGTIHAFDALTTSLSELKGVGRECTVENGVIKLEEKEFSFTEYDTQKKYLTAQWADNRRKLEMFFSVTRRVKFSTAVNLWSPPPVVSRRNRPALELRPKGEYDILDQDDNFADDFVAGDGDDDFGQDFAAPGVVDPPVVGGAQTSQTQPGPYVGPPTDQNSQPVPSAASHPPKPFSQSAMKTQAGQRKQASTAEKPNPFD